MATEAEIVAARVRELAETLENPSRWRVLIPYEIFYEVEHRLDAEQDAGAYYRGVSLCYTTRHDEARAEMYAPLSACIETLREGDDGD